MTTDAVTDYVVIGAGLAGSSAAWRLAQAGHSVTLLERDEPASEHGSSHGSARIFRYPYTDPYYIRLVDRASVGWAELESRGTELIRRTGCVDFGQTRDPENLSRLLTEVGIDHALLTAEEAAERWPGIRTNGPAMWHASAGVIDAQTTVRTMVAAATELGASVLTGFTVESVTRSGSGFTVTAGPDSTAEVPVVHASHVIVAAGGFLPGLLGNLDLPAGFLAALPRFEVRQEMAFHFPCAHPEEAMDWPTFIHKTPGIQTYSLPGGRDADFRGQKLAEFNGGPVIPDASAQTGLIDPAHRERIISYVRENVPGLVPEPYAETTCLFTNTPDEEFVIDSAGGVTVLSACSGHGAKFAPLLGELAHEVATGGIGERRLRPSLA